MAREMTPQERAEYAAANIYDVVKRFAYPYASIEKIVLRAVTETRRAALLEAAQRAGLGDCNSLLDAPCLWCGYNGSGYYQAGTHDQSCIWRDVGGERERIDRLAQEG